MRIASAEIDDKPGVVASERGGPWFELAASSLQEWLDGGLRVESRRPVNESALRFRAPFARPGQIIALARNYTAHAKESTLPVPHEPIFFSKSNTSVIGPGDAVVLPPNLG